MQQRALGKGGPPALDRLEENLAAADGVLTVADLRDIESAAANIEVRGARRPERLERITGR